MKLIQSLSFLGSGSQIGVLPVSLRTNTLMAFLSYLAADMEEDYHTPKEAIFSFLYGDSNCARRPLFHKLRFQIFRSMGCRAWVSKEELEEVTGLWGSGGGGNQTGERRDHGGSRSGLGNERDLGLGKGSDRDCPDSVHLLRGCLSFQIQAFDPELWVWRRDRSLLSDITEPEVDVQEGRAVSAQVQTE